MSVTMLAYALFVIWGAIALVTLVMTDLSARRRAHAGRTSYERPRVIARADRTSIPAVPYRRANG
ncbi:MAG: hypothetical protein QOD83_27 [Solirubrobacteraceae bacterium]|jgi:hypothetical protein|nr:hypothetical protein [Solirubrobacteraceae bacterium]